MTTAIRRERRPLPTELEQLQDKYREIQALRRERERGDPPPPNSRLRALAMRFPGALRELDQLPPALLDQRASELEACMNDPAKPPPSWVDCVWGFHTVLDCTLRLRAGVPQAEVLAFARHRGFELAEEFLEQISRPPRERMSRLAVATLAPALGLEPDDVRRRLGWMT